MTNEEFEKKMEFIVEHQAQFASDIQQLREAQTRAEQRLAQTEDLLTRLVTVTFEGFKDVNAKIDALVDSQIRLTDRVDALTADVSALAARHDALAVKVETLTITVQALATRHDALAVKVDALATDLSALTAKVNTLADAQSLTDKNLRNLITVVDRYIQEGRNSVQ